MADQHKNNRQTAKKEYDCLYASARIRALEARLVGTDALNRFCEMPSSAAVINALTEFGATVVQNDEGRTDREVTLLSLYERAVREVSFSMEDASLMTVLQYPYDCNNAKAVIKCTARGVDTAPLLFPMGSVPTEKLPVPSGSAEGILPSHMAVAFGKAAAAFPSGGNPQVVDMLLDAACYLDMANAAANCGCSLAIWYVSVRADLVNMAMCARLLRMKAGDGGRAQLVSSLLSVGTVVPEKWLALYDAGEDALWDFVKHSAYAAVAGSAETSLGSLERAADNYVMEHVKTVRYLPFGQDVIFAYLLAVETSIRNLRILLSAKDAGMSPAEIRERMRLSYV